MPPPWQTSRAATGVSVGSGYNTTQTESFKVERTGTIRTVAGGAIKLRGRSDNLPQQWWFASTAIPLVAATIGPLSNVLSIAALVTPWRVTLPDNGQLPEGTDDAGLGIADPHWEIVLNAMSLACGFIGNVFLLLNFTGRVRYIVALPLSIIFWIMSSTLLIAITSAMSIYVPPIWPREIYSQGFWHAVIAAILYMSGGIILTINMIGYFRGHYPQQFDLDDDQRTLILQTMMFFFWLAGGAGVFCALEGWTYPDALYYADVSVLTIGFGDIAPVTNAGRGVLFIFEIVGIIFLGLVISSINRFAAHIGADKIIKRHQIHARESTVGRTVTNERELRERLGLPPRNPSAVTNRSGRTGHSSSIGNNFSGISQRRRDSLTKYGHIEIVGRTVTFHERKVDGVARGGGRGGAGRTHKRALSRDEKLRAREHANSANERRKRRRQKLLLLQEEKDRFDAMRQIQEETKRWKQYWSLSMAFLAFGLLWCIGALVFMVTENRILGLSYFEALYFCFVALLSIGYGDLSPKSNVGKPFFIVWSLIAVPIVTVLIQNASRTIVSAINRGTFKLADWTIMPRAGVVHDFLDQHPRLRDAIEDLQERRRARKRIARGFEVQNPDDVSPRTSEDDIEQGGKAARVRGRLRGGRDRMRGASIFDTVSAATGGTFAHATSTGTSGVATPDGVPLTALERLAAEDSEHHLARQLALSIKAVAQDLRAEPPKRYSYEEWVHFTKLIRFSRRTRQEVEAIEDEEGLVEWDWIGEDSPMLADITEAEWVLNRLCESLNRYTRRQAGRNRLLHYKNKKLQEENHHNEPVTEGETDSANGGPSKSEDLKDLKDDEDLEEGYSEKVDDMDDEDDEGTEDADAEVMTDDLGDVKDMEDDLENMEDVEICDDDDEEEEEEDDDDDISHDDDGTEGTDGVNDADDEVERPRGEIEREDGVGKENNSRRRIEGLGSSSPGTDTAGTDMKDTVGSRPTEKDKER